MEISEFRNPYAELYRPDSGVLVSAESGAGSFYCPHPNCLDPSRRLFKKRSKNGRAFFSHYGDYEHPINFETLLHKMTIRFFTQLDLFELPPLNGVTETIRVDRARTVIEYNGLNEIKPDVRIVTDSGVEYLIEIFVTHETKGKKLFVIGKHDIPTIEINLSQFYSTNFELCKFDLAFVQSCVPNLISDIKLKRWLHHPNITLDTVDSGRDVAETKSAAQDTSVEKFALGAATLAVLLAFPFVRKWLGRMFGFRLTRGRIHTMRRRKLKSSKWAR